MGARLDRPGANRDQDFKRAGAGEPPLPSVPSPPETRQEQAIVQVAILAFDDSRQEIAKIRPNIFQAIWRFITGKGEMLEPEQTQIYVANQLKLIANIDKEAEKHLRKFKSAVDHGDSSKLSKLEENGKQTQKLDYLTNRLEAAWEKLAQLSELAPSDPLATLASNIGRHQSTLKVITELYEKEKVPIGQNALTSQEEDFLAQLLTGGQKGPDLYGQLKVEAYHDLIHKLSFQAFHKQPNKAVTEPEKKMTQEEEEKLGKAQEKIRIEQDKQIDDAKKQLAILLVRLAYEQPKLYQEIRGELPNGAKDPLVNYRIDQALQDERMRSTWNYLSEKVGGHDIYRLEGLLDADLIDIDMNKLNAANIPLQIVIPITVAEEHQRQILLEKCQNFVSNHPNPPNDLMKLVQYTVPPDMSLADLKKLHAALTTLERNNRVHLMQLEEDRQFQHVNMPIPGFAREDYTDFTESSKFDLGRMPLKPSQKINDVLLLQRLDNAFQEITKEFPSIQLEIPLYPLEKAALRTQTSPRRDEVNLAKARAKVRVAEMNKIQRRLALEREQKERIDKKQEAEKSTSRGQAALVPAAGAEPASPSSPGVVAALSSPTPQSPAAPETKAEAERPAAPPASPAAPSVVAALQPAPSSSAAPAPPQTESDLKRAERPATTSLRKMFNEIEGYFEKCEAAASRNATTDMRMELNLARTNMQAARGLVTELQRTDPAATKELSAKLSQLNVRYLDLDTRCLTLSLSQAFNCIEDGLERNDLAHRAFHIGRANGFLNELKERNPEAAKEYDLTFTRLRNQHFVAVVAEFNAPAKAAVEPEAEEAEHSAPSVVAALRRQPEATSLPKMFNEIEGNFKKSEEAESRNSPASMRVALNLARTNMQAARDLVTKLEQTNPTDAKELSAKLSELDVRYLALDTRCLTLSLSQAFIGIERSFERNGLASTAYHLEQAKTFLAELRNINPEVAKTYDLRLAELVVLASEAVEFKAKAEARAKAEAETKAAEPFTELSWAIPALPPAPAAAAPSPPPPAPFQAASSPAVPPPPPAETMETVATAPSEPKTEPKAAPTGAPARPMPEVVTPRQQVGLAIERLRKLQTEKRDLRDIAGLFQNFQKEGMLDSLRDIYIQAPRSTYFRPTSAGELTPGGPVPERVWASRAMEELDKALAPGEEQEKIWNRVRTGEYLPPKKTDGMDEKDFEERATSYKDEFDRARVLYQQCPSPQALLQFHQAQKYRYVAQTPSAELISRNFAEIIKFLQPNARGEFPKGYSPRDLTDVVSALRKMRPDAWALMSGRSDIDEAANFLTPDVMTGSTKSEILARDHLLEAKRKISFLRQLAKPMPPGGLKNELLTEAKTLEEEIHILIQSNRRLFILPDPKGPGMKVIDGGYDNFPKLPDGKVDPRKGVGVLIDTLRQIKQYLVFNQESLASHALDIKKWEDIVTKGEALLKKVGEHPETDADYNAWKEARAKPALKRQARAAGPEIKRKAAEGEPKPTPAKASATTPSPTLARPTHTHELPSLDDPGITLINTPSDPIVPEQVRALKNALEKIKKYLFFNRAQLTPSSRPGGVNIEGWVNIVKKGEALLRKIEPDRQPSPLDQNYEEWVNKAPFIGG